MGAKVTIYTDGSALGNPGRGGYGVVMMSGAHRKEISDGFLHTTNNRMELLAVIVGLEALKAQMCDVTIYSDSSYVVNAIEKGWLKSWTKAGFAGKKNVDLWRRFLEIYPKHKVKMVWIKGHAEIPENERCDVLAKAAAAGANLKTDHGYIATETKSELI